MATDEIVGAEIIVATDASTNLEATSNKLEPSIDDLFGDDDDDNNEDNIEVNVDGNVDDDEFSQPIKRKALGDENVQKRSKIAIFDDGDSD